MSADSVTMWSPGGRVWATPVSSVQSAVALDATDGVVVTAGRDPTTVTVLSERTGALERTVPLPAAGGWQTAVLAVNPATGTVWVAMSSPEAAEVAPLDPETGKFGTPIALPQPDQPAAAAWGDGELVLANSIDGVAFVNPTTGSVTNVGLPAEPGGVAVSPGGEVAATLPGTDGGEVALLSSPTASPDIVPASGVGMGVVWDSAAAEFAASDVVAGGTLFVGVTGQETQLTWPYFPAAGGPFQAWQLIAPVAGGVAEDSRPGGVAFVVEGLADVGAIGVVVAPASPPDATCEVLAGPTAAGPWEVVGSEPCHIDGNYLPLAVEVPAGDTWFAARAVVNAWQSPPTPATEWSVPTAAGSGG